MQAVISCIGRLCLYSRRLWNGCYSFQPVRGDAPPTDCRFKNIFSRLQPMNLFSIFFYTMLHTCIHYNNRPSWGRTLLRDHKSSMPSKNCNVCLESFQKEFWSMWVTRKRLSKWYKRGRKIYLCNFCQIAAVMRQFA